MKILIAHLAVVAGLSGCAPFAVNWYHEPAADSSSRDEVVLAVLNRGDEPCLVQDIRLNAMASDEHGFLWTPATPARLQPGQLLVVPLSDFHSAACVLPIQIDIRAKECSIRDEGTFRVRLPARLPGSLPESWVAGCKQPHAKLEPAR